jgi:hypothetical protein
VTNTRGLVKDARGVLWAQSESHPDYPALVRALVEGFGVPAEDVEQGAPLIFQALRGFGMRNHVDLFFRPDQVERGIEAAPPEGPDREAWLFGYRFVEREKPSDA